MIVIIITTTKIMIVIIIIITTTKIMIVIIVIITTALILIVATRPVLKDRQLSGTTLSMGKG